VQRIELTPQTVHSGVYKDKHCETNGGQLRVKRSGEALKVQHTLTLGEQNFIQASFGKRHQTKFGGAPLLSQLEMNGGFIRGAAGALRDPRVTSQVKYTLYQLPWQRVLLICCGYEDANDSALLAHDPGLRLAVLAAGGEEQIGLASQPTICRFENKMSAANCYRLAAWLLYTYIANKRTAPKAIRLDLDGSCIPTYGQQQGSSYRKYYDTEMFFPLFVFDDEGVLITAVLRPGEYGEARMTLPVLRRIVKEFRKAWPDVEITVVMDAAFNDPAIYDWCEDQGSANKKHTVSYLMKLKNCGGDGSGLCSSSKDLAKRCKESFSTRYGAARYLAPEKTKRTKPSKSKTRLEKELRQIESRQERRLAWSEHLGRVTRRYGEFSHRTGKGGQDKKQWRHDRRVLVECTYDDWGPRSTFWVTNILLESPDILINEVYARRANAELRIKDAKAFRCDKLSCQNFIANQFRLLMHVLAQRMLFSFRELLPPAGHRVSLESVREQYICIPAIVEQRARGQELVWSHNYPHKNRMHAVCERLTRPRCRIRAA